MSWLMGTPFPQESNKCMFQVCSEAENEINTDGNKALESLPGMGKFT